MKRADYWMSVTRWGWLVGKSASARPGLGQGESSEEPKAWNQTSKKELLAVDGDRTKTDTGG